MPIKFKRLVLKKGLDIPIKGKAAPVVLKRVVPDVVAIKPTDFKGLVPRLLVREGDKVLAGSPVMADKLHPEILITSPVSVQKNEPHVISGALFGGWTYV